MAKEIMMLERDLELIDEVIASIKEKGKLGLFNKFDFYFILSLEIARYELLTTELITDTTAVALTQLFTFQAHEYYYRDFPLLYSLCSSLGYNLSEYNADWKNHNLSALGVNDKKWIKYFRHAISDLTLSNPPNN